MQSNFQGASGEGDEEAKNTTEGNSALLRVPPKTHNTRRRQWHPSCRNWYSSSSWRWCNIFWCFSRGIYLSSDGTVLQHITNRSIKEGEGINERQELKKKTFLRMCSSGFTPTASLKSLSLSLTQLSSLISFLLSNILFFLSSVSSHGFTTPFFRMWENSYFAPWERG